LSSDLGVVSLVENRPLEGREIFLVVNNYLIIAWICAMYEKVREAEKVSELEFSSKLSSS